MRLPFYTIFIIWYEDQFIIWEWDFIINASFSLITLINIHTYVHVHLHLSQLTLRLKQFDVIVDGGFLEYTIFQEICGN